MQNDITSAKKFRDDYFNRLGHGMNDHTVISLMLDYAATVNTDNNSSVDIETVLQDNENLKEQNNGLQILVESQSLEIDELKEKVLSLESEKSEVLVETSSERNMTVDEMDELERKHPSLLGGGGMKKTSKKK